MKKVFLYIALAPLSLIVACQQMTQPEQEPQDRGTVVEVVPTATKTSLGEISQGKRPLYWENGDQLALNGVASNPLEGVDPESSSAIFTFDGSFSSPYKMLYPASLFLDASHVTFPAIQTWAADAVVAVPLAAEASSLDGVISLGHLASILHVRVKKNADISAANLVSVVFKGNADEQVCGDFEIDYSTATLTPAGDGDQLTLEVDQPLSESTDLDMYMIVPSGTYSNGFTVVLEDALHRTMTKKTGAITMEKGQIKRGASFEFTPSALCSEFIFDSDEIEEEVIAPATYNVTGRVVDSVSGEGLEGVVVSDGLKCVRTLQDGRFYLQSNLSKTKFVWVSTPSGYLPPVSGGIPQYYKLKSDITPAAGVYDFGDYVLDPDTSTDPDHFTFFMTADPQPRGNYIIDYTAYRSLEICQDLYSELAQTAAPILTTGQNVFGMCLGDIVHEDMSLYGQYVTGLGTLGYPTYNVIGNHDNDPDAADDDAGAIPFESHFGPRNYSFNMGGIHFVVLDDIIMSIKNGKLTGQTYGLTDDIWEWLQADLSFIPVSSTLMVFAHSPLFRMDTGSERTNTSIHGSDYGGLINKYAEVHAWAGHTHCTFNYNYPSDHRHKRVQVHTLARSTGELWTNEYLAEDGTPRGFTIVDIKDGKVSWKFHPTTYQNAEFKGKYSYNSGKYPAYDPLPSYTYRDWNYNGGTAAMKAGGGPLTEEYQMHVYAPGVYEDGYVYANIFLWDDKWETPKFSMGGAAATDMTYIEYTEEGSYDKACWELHNYYTSNANARKRVGSAYALPSTKGRHTIFKVACAEAHGTGTVSVTDRFGNNYTGSVTW